MKHTNIYIYINREAVVAPVKQMLGIKAPQSAELRENPCIQTKINTDIPKLYPNRIHPVHPPPQV